MNWKQFLTEKVLHECSCGKPDYLGTANGHKNRTFDNESDMMAVYRAIHRDGKWKEFTEYAFRFYKEDYSEEQFNTWLFCPKGKDPEVLYRCFIVSAWLEVNDSQSTVVSPIIVNGRSVSLEEGEMKHSKWDEPEETESTISVGKGETMTGFKAYGKGMVCKGFQYQEGETYECEKAEICKSGFHFCENPLDVLNYYNLCESEFSTVESLGKTQKHDEDSKVCTTKIKIGAKLSLPAFIKASVDFLLTKTTGDKITAASGHSSKLAASGDSSQLAASGDSSQLAASGYSSKLEINGLDSVGAAIGVDCIIKGSVGNWITLSEWEYASEKQRYIPVCVKSTQIDGKKIKADTFYTLKNGKFVEVD